MLRYNLLFLLLIIMCHRRFQSKSFCILQSGLRLLLSSLALVVYPLSINAQDNDNTSVMGMVAGLGYGKLKSNDATDKEFVFNRR